LTSSSRAAGRILRKRVAERAVVPPFVPGVDQPKNIVMWNANLRILDGCNFEVNFDLTSCGSKEFSQLDHSYF